MKVKYRLPMVIVLVAIIPVIIVAFVGFKVLSNVSLVHYKNLIANQSAASAKHLGDFFAEQSSTINYSANLDTYKTYLTLTANQKPIPPELKAQALKLLYLAQQINPGVKQVNIADTMGIVQLSSDPENIGMDISDDTAFANALQSGALTYRTTQQGNEASIVMAMPIIDDENGKVLGVLLRDINMDYLNRYVRELRIGETGYLYVLDSDGNTLSHFYEERMDATEYRNDPGTTNLVAFIDQLKNNTLQKNSGFIEYSISGREMLANFEIVPEIGWAVVAAIPFDEITESAQDFRTIILYTVLFVIIGSVVLGLISARKITVPLEEIRRTVASIAAGNLDAKMKYTGKDEFSELYSDIELMTRQLEKSYASLSKSAKTDMLTGIPNRMAVYEEMDKRFDNTKNQAALLLDLDGFKQINDTLGHDYGDEVLIKVAGVLQALSNEFITCARLGGDEFFIYVSQFTTQDDVIVLGKEILAGISSINEAMGKPVHISASIGIAFADHADTNKSRLIKKADLAMYDVKSSGKDNILVFDNTVIIHEDY